MKLSIAAIVLFAVAAFSLREGPNIHRDNQQVIRQIQIAGGPIAAPKPTPWKPLNWYQVTQRTGVLGPKHLAMALETYRNK